ncbi:hypothetical protein BGZ59_002131 [Podila verticillata]|nr:hypothetical protein BGZ59_002131 [Podila verticillata]KAI9235295.1 MAG: hypothetical protein BYD32DRAFT_421411 [Podila humilis]
MSKRKHPSTGGMHPSNPYSNNPPDFAALAQKYPSLKPYVMLKTQQVSGKPSVYGAINFRDPLALRELTYCLLRNDFSIELDIPLDSLCPAVPNRVNYICWLEDLVGHSEKKTVSGIDVGTGASCIYPLLACVRNKTWQMVGTDISDDSISFATNNVARNNLQNSITVLKNNTPRIFPPELFALENKKYDFCMCNPPFYKDEQDIHDSQSSKTDIPAAVCLGNENEMVTEGGEVQFVMQMIHESMVLKDTIRWYTSMLGKRSSVDQVVAFLKEQKIANYIPTTFHQGRTGRWAIAWSFGDEHPSWETTQQVSAKMAKLSAPKTVLAFDVAKSLGSVLDSTRAILDDLQLQYMYDAEEQDIQVDNHHSRVVQVQATKNTWSRAARRAMSRQAKSNPPKSDPTEPIVLQFDIRVISATTTSTSSSLTSSSASAAKLPNNSTLHLAWTFGQDRDLFESFFLHFRSRIEKG